MSLRRKILYVLGGLFVLLLAGIAVIWVLVSSPRPEGGVSGAEADELARRVQREVKLDQWPNTGAISWTHAKRNKHLWDKRRNLDRIRFPDGGEVLLDVGKKDGIAISKGGERLEGEAKAKELERAYRWWANDSFWLNPFAKLFDEGVTREKVAEVKGAPGAVGLYVKYASGGVTPGDSYLWVVPPQGPPNAWRMWVSVLPIGGMRVSWHGWKELPSGGVVATLHDLAGVVHFELNDVQAAATAEELNGGTDPFAELFGKVPAQAAVAGTATATVAGAPAQVPSSQPVH